MGELFVSWLESNVNRKYPLRDSATCKAANGTRIPNGFLADLHVAMPDDLGAVAFLGSASASPSVLSLTILAAPADPCFRLFLLASEDDYVLLTEDGEALELEDEGTIYDEENPPPLVPIAALTVKLPIRPYRHYDLSPLAPGCGGWAAFGPAAGRTRFSCLFQYPDQSALLDRTVFRYPRPGLTGVGPEGPTPLLTGLVRLRGDPGKVLVTGGQAVIGGVTRTVAFVSLDPSAGGRQVVMRRFAGDCGGRPSTKTCDPPAAASLASVTPDAAGNVNLEFRGRFEAGSLPTGMVVDSHMGLGAVCPDAGSPWKKILPA